MKRASAKIVLKLLNFEQKQRRMDIVQEMFTTFNDDSDLLKKVITGDKSWLYRYGIETKFHGHRSGDVDDVQRRSRFAKKVITGDESWAYGYDIETKAQSSQWKRTEEPRPKKARQVRSSMKVLLTIFFGCNGVV